MPKISGLTIVRNGQLFDYPFEESIRSMLPWVDELIVNVDPGEDQTLEAIQRISKEESSANKIKIIQSQWPLSDPEKKRGGNILSEQTNLALAQAVYPWCLYLQADEVLHEDDQGPFRAALEAAEAIPEVEGLVFDYLHFYGSYDIIQKSRSAYRREVRCFKRDPAIVSVGDAQSFRKRDGTKLNVVSSRARVFHYGWVKPPQTMKSKTYFMDQLYHGDPSAEQQASQTPHTGDNYRYKRIWGLRPFKDTHPSVMRDRIEKKNWHWNYADQPLEWKPSDVFKVALDLIEAATGVRLFEYRSFRWY